jgi:hypothetical protein
LAVLELLARQRLEQQQAAALHLAQQAAALLHSEDLEQHQQARLPLAPRQQQRRRLGRRVLLQLRRRLALRLLLVDLGRQLQHSSR